MDAKEFKETIYEIAILVIALIAWVLGIISVSYGIIFSGLTQYSWAVDLILLVALLCGFVHVIQGIYDLVSKLEDPEEEVPPTE